MPSIKDRILAGIAQNGGIVANPRDLRIHAKTGQHAIVHVIWRLQKQGLITFKEDHQSRGLSIPTNLRLTAAGRKAAKTAIKHLRTEDQP